VEEFNQVIADQQAGDDGVLLSVTSQSHASLGMIARNNGDFESAVAHIEDAIELSSPYYRVRFYALLGDTYSLSGDCKNAVQAYQDGIAFAETTGDGKTIDQLEEILAALNCP
jgi:tetratricopeptide (TPR) repeat protein